MPYQCWHASCCTVKQSANRLLEGDRLKDQDRVKVLFFSTTTEGAGRGIQERLGTLVPEGRVEVYRSIEDLANGLHRLLDPDTIAILRARDREELSHIVSMRDLLQGVRVILLLPDGEEETIALGHRLRPRFLSNGENDFSDTLSVLRKMLRHGE